MLILLKDPFVLLACTFLVCTLCQWIAWRVRLPAIIFLLLAGILAGPVFNVLEPEVLLGKMFYPFVSLSVAIILFEGSLTLKFKEILGLEAVVRNMLSFGLLITWLITTLFTKWAIGLSWEMAALFGAITVVTGPTVIAPLLRTVRPSASVANILRWEGIVIDPIGAALAVLVFEFIISGGGRQALGSTLLIFGQILVMSGGIGVIAGYGFGLILRKHWLPEFLQNIAILAVVFTIFVISNLLQPDSGLVAVTVMGVWLANMPGVDLDEILEFKEHLSILLVSLLFILLTAGLDVEAIRELGWSVLIVFLAVQFLARPLNIMASSIGSKLSFPERHLLAWIAPRGIVAAAISSLFAIQLQQAGYQDADYLVPLTFSIIIGTVLLQSFTSLPIARWLGVAEPEPDGFLIIGANKVARAVATALHDAGVRVLLVDTGWEKISKAKHSGLTTYHGNPISAHANRHMDLVGIGKMLALSPYYGVNMAAVLHYKMEFGKEKVYALNSNGEKGGESGKVLFAQTINYEFLEKLIAQGAKVHTTQLTSLFDFQDFTRLQGEHGTPLFAVDPKGSIFPFHPQPLWQPKNGWSIIYLNHHLIQK